MERKGKESRIRVPAYPLSAGGNLEFRRWLLDRGDRSAADRREILSWCRQSLLFWVNCFCWLFEPRSGRKLPFICYPYQQRLLTAMDKAVGKHDLVIEKSRDMGATWCSLAVFRWRVQYMKMQSFLLMSMKEDLVDKSGDPKSLFWKIDFLHRHLPLWMQPAIQRQKLHCGFPDSGGTIDGDSTTSTAGTGDRRTAVFFDEFSKVPNGFDMLKASRDVTNSRFFNSSFNGRGNAFFEIARGASSQNFPKVSLHWPLHPEKSKGLYHDANGKPRSPWYDEQCRRVQDLREIAEELDMDPTASDYMFFDPARIDELKAVHARPPYLTASLELNADFTRVEAVLRNPRGACHFWTHLGDGMVPPAGRTYFLGVDVGGGTGSSDSTMSVFDAQTNEKVFEWRAKHFQPHDWAKRAVAVARLFYNAQVIWEANGAGGRNFTTTLTDVGYYHVFRAMRRHNRQGKKQKPGEQPGFYSSPETKSALLSDYRAALYDERFINRSGESLLETLGYVHYPGSRIEHAPSVAGIDPSKSGKNHGDMVIADALAWHAARETCRIRETRQTMKGLGVKSNAERYCREVMERELESSTPRW